MKNKILLLTVCFLSLGMKAPDKVKKKYSAWTFQMPASKPFAFGAVQTAHHSVLNSTSNTVTISASGSNNLVVVSIMILSTNSIGTITDNSGNTYQSARDILVSGAYRLAIYFAFQVSSGTTSVTVPISSVSDYDVVVNEYSGFTGTPTNAECLDASNYDQTVSAVEPMTANSISPINTSCLIVSTSFTDSDIQTVGSGYTLHGVGNLYGGTYLKTEYKLSSSTTENGQWTHNGYSGWAVIVVSYKQEDATAPPSAGKAIRSSGNKP